MSVSMYRNQLDRLTKEISDFEKKAADERTRATRERGDAVRKERPISGPEHAQSRLREIQRHEERAAPSDLGGQIATKKRSLSSAQKSLERALADERQKEDWAARRRREEDIRHLRSLENARRGESRGLMSPGRWARFLRDDNGTFEYDVCLSFAGEQRDYVEMIARGPKQHGLRVFYDEDETASLWGKDLSEHLDHIYREASRYCVIFFLWLTARRPGLGMSVAAPSRARSRTRVSTSSPRDSTTSVKTDRDMAIVADLPGTGAE